TSYIGTSYIGTSYIGTSYIGTSYMRTTKKVSILLALSIALGIHTPCYGLYVMVRSGFGELKPDGDIGSFEKQQGTLPTWEATEWIDPRAHHEDPDTVVFSPSNTFVRNTNCSAGRFEYKGHKNLSVALGGRFDIFDIGALGIEVEILGGYANLGRKQRDRVEPHLAGPQLNYDDMDHINIERPDFLRVQYTDWGMLHMAHIVPMYLKNQRIAGIQANFYWEQYILDWLSAGIGGGLGGAYVCTKFTTFERWRVLDIGVDPTGHRHFMWYGYGNNPIRRSKYVHSGSLLYNFTLFVRAEKFETLFEVGYRHIGLHQMFGAKCYGYEIPKLASMHSDQIYLGVGRTF
ncbi:MAG: hypothetical protein MJ218_03920, partial [Opitutales bacterium]|nr:hypothetical protein [Opitutales bacterium]